MSWAGIGMKTDFFQSFCHCWVFQICWHIECSIFTASSFRIWKLTRRTFVGKVMSLLFNMLSRLIIAFLPRKKHLLISWLLSLSTVILESKQIKSVTVSIFSPSIYHEVMGLDAMILVFWMLSFKPAFHSPLSPSARSSLISLHSAIRMASSAYLRFWYFSWQYWFQLVIHPAWQFSWCTLHIS